MSTIFIPLPLKREESEGRYRYILSTAYLG